MENIVKQGRLVFAVAIIAFGVENLLCARYGVSSPKVFSGHTVLSVIPWVPAQAWLGYLTGLFLILAGLSVIANAKARLAATALGVFFLLCVLLRINFIWESRTVSFELLAMCGSALVLAGTLPSEARLAQPWKSALDALIYVRTIHLRDHTGDFRHGSFPVSPVRRQPCATVDSLALVLGVFLWLRDGRRRYKHRNKMDGALGSDVDWNHVSGLVRRSSPTANTWPRRRIGAGSAA